MYFSRAAAVMRATYSDLSSELSEPVEWASVCSGEAVRIAKCIVPVIALQAIICILVIS
jgi:hypothetical protein